MEKIILITPDELRQLIEEVVSNALDKISKPVDLPEHMSLDDAVVFLTENGFQTSKALVYKLTSKNRMPYSKWGNKLVFSRKELLEWALKHLVKVTCNDGPIKHIIYKNL